MPVYTTNCVLIFDRAACIVCPHHTWSSLFMCTPLLICDPNTVDGQVLQALWLYRLHFSEFNVIGSISKAGGEPLQTTGPTIDFSFFLHFKQVNTVEANVSHLLMLQTIRPIQVKRPIWTLSSHHEQWTYDSHWFSVFLLVFKGCSQVFTSWLGMPEIRS